MSFHCPTMYNVITQSLASMTLLFLTMWMSTILWVHWKPPNYHYSAPVIHGSRVGYEQGGISLTLIEEWPYSHSVTAPYNVWLYGRHSTWHRHVENGSKGVCTPLDSIKSTLLAFKFVGGFCPSIFSCLQGSFSLLLCLLLGDLDWESAQSSLWSDSMHKGQFLPPPAFARKGIPYNVLLSFFTI